MSTIVRFYPEKDSDLAKVAEANKRDYLTAAVESENKNGTINVIVSVPEPVTTTPCDDASWRSRNSAARSGSAANVQPQTEATRSETR